MCGICALFGLSSQPIDLLPLLQKQSRLSCRGPDKSHHAKLQLDDGRCGLLAGYVLHFRGDELVPQPAQDDAGNQMLWNGEIFGGIEMGHDECDTTLLLDLFGRDDSDENIVNTMSRIQGPWSFIYWQAATSSLWFGRDVFGRRSLLWHIPESESNPFILSSVRIRSWVFQEVPSIGIYKVNFNTAHSNQPNYKITVIPWRNTVWPGTLEPVVNDGEFAHRLYTGNIDENVTISLREDQCIDTHMPTICKSLPPPDHSLPVLDQQQSFDEYLKDLCSTDSYLRTLSRQLTSVLLEAVRVRVGHQHRQSTVIGQDQTKNDTDYKQNHNEATSINLPVNMDASCNSTIDPHQTSNRLHDLSPSATNCSTISPDQTADPVLTSQAGIAPDQTADPSLTSVAGVDPDQMADPVLTSGAGVAILFSGGIDSTVLAALADRCIPAGNEIDLLNVAFEMKHKENPTNKKKRPADLPEDKKWDVPDRQTGYIALSELNPNRTWNFVEINVTAVELHEARQSPIEYLLHPLQTVLDDSIGCAVWFASRGVGILGNGPSKGTNFVSKAKVILCGMGADEQLVGYSRHRVRFKGEGWEGLLNEIQLEITRLSARNLGRDDRIVTDHGKESRIPYLDENVVKFLSDIPVYYKADLTLPRGLGEKLLLRMGAYELGLHQTATLPKRAIQFGSRIAKMENNKEKASDKCDRLGNNQNALT